MKILQMMALSLLLPLCANAKSSIITSKFALAGDPLPRIQHMIDMKVSGDTLLFVYESNDGYGQRFQRRALIDLNTNQLVISPDMGKLEDGYYVSSMPYPFITDNGAIKVIGQDDTEFYTVKDDTVLIRTKQYLLDGNSTMPFPLSRYVQDIFQTDSDRYVFIGREPMGGRQFALSSDLTSAKVDTIRQISVSPKLQSWMPNMGEMAYSAKNKCIAFAYSLHPLIEIFDTEGNIIASVRIGNNTFNPNTLTHADLNDLNAMHTVDITYTPDYIYALYWGFRHVEVAKSRPTVIQIDWNGNITARYSNFDRYLYRISAVNNSTLIGWTGKEFVRIAL